MTRPLHPVIRRYYESYNARRFQEGADLSAPDTLIEHAPYGRVADARGLGYLESAERSIVAFPMRRSRSSACKPTAT